MKELPARDGAEEALVAPRDDAEGRFPFQGVPGSKSVTVRALFLAAAAHGTTVLHRPLVSDDSMGFAEGLAALGYRLSREPGRWTVEGRVRGPAAEEASVFCRDGATTARFLPVLAAPGHGVFHFDASAQMRRRPLGPLTRALRDLGFTLVHREREGHHPLTVHADGIRGEHITLDAGLSSQFLTALLLVGPLTEQGLTITVSDLVSAPYVDITVAMMERFGVRVHREADTFTVPAQPYLATDYTIEPDASTASYFLAAAALTGRRVTIPGLGAGSLQGDLRFAQVLSRMGAHVADALYGQDWHFPSYGRGVRPRLRRRGPEIAAGHVACRRLAHRPACRGRPRQSLGTAVLR